MIANQVQGDEEEEECARAGFPQAMAATGWVKAAPSMPAPLRLGSKLASLSSPSRERAGIVLAKSLPD